MIESTANPKVLYAWRLLHRKWRKRENRCVIEGFHLLDEALRAGVSIDYVLATPEALCSAPETMRRIELRSVPVYRCNEKVLQRISDVQSPQGVVAVCQIPARCLPPAIKFCVLFLEDIQDPGNVGTTIRTAHAVGADGVFVTASTADPFGPKCLRASMGSVFYIPLFVVENLNVFCKKLPQPIPVYAAHMAGKSVFDVRLKTPFALALGNEGAGLSEGLLRHAHEQVSVPMPGGAESLNVSVSCAVILYEALRQFRQTALL